MSEFYDNAAANAAKLLAKFGKVFTFTRKAETRDPVTGAVTAAPPVTLTAKGIFKQIRKELVDGVLVQAGDRIMIIDNSFEPLLTDTVTVGGSEWSIVNVDELAPAGIPVIYYVQVRR